MRSRYNDYTVVPAKAGTHNTVSMADVLWIPAFAGMTVVVLLAFSLMG